MINFRYKFYIILRVYKKRSDFCKKSHFCVRLPTCRYSLQCGLDAPKIQTKRNCGERVVEGRTNDFGLGFVPHPLGLGGQTVNPHLPNLGILLDLGYLAVCMLKFLLFADFSPGFLCVFFDRSHFVTHPHGA